MEVFHRVFIGVICGLIGSGMASHKNRGGVTGFFLGFFLWIIGIIIVAVMPAAAPPPPKGMKAIPAAHGAMPSRTCRADEVSADCWRNVNRRLMSVRQFGDSQAVNYWRTHAARFCRGMPNCRDQ